MFDKNDVYSYNLFLCNMDKTIICALEYIDISYSQNFLQFDELQFTVPYEDNGWRTINNATFNYLQPFYLILMESCNNDDIIESKYFIITDPSFSYDDGKTQKVIKCYSSDYEFNNRYLNMYEEVRTLYDSVNNYDPYDSTKGGIINYILDQMVNTWSVNYISPSLLNLYHSYNFSSSTYRSVFENLQDQFNCYFTFDTTTNSINIYDAMTNELGESTDIVLSDENYIKSLKCDIKNSEMVTSLRVYGADNITCVKYNPRGTIDIRDYSYFFDNGRMSTSLSNAYTEWINLIDANNTTFQGYLSSLDTLESSLTTANNELVALNEELKVIQQHMDDEKQENEATTSTYTNLYADYVSKQNEISEKQSEIDGYNSQINLINQDIIALNSLLSIENNFNLTQRQALSKMTIESKLNMDSVDNEQQLYEYAVNYMKIKNKPSIDIDLDLIDLFNINSKFLIDRYDKIKVGNYVYIDCSSLGFNYDKYRITRISHDTLSNKLSIMISNKDRINAEINYLNRIFKANVESTSTVETNKFNYAQYTKDSGTIIYKDSTINAEETVITSGSTNNVSINGRGFIGGDIGSTYGSSIEIRDGKLVIVYNNGADYRTILSSNGLHIESPNKSRCIIHKDTGIQIDKYEDGTWVNQMYIDNNGNAIFTGTINGGKIISDSSIDITTDINVGNNIKIGNLSNYANKSIKFYSSGTNVSNITINESGLFTIKNFGDLQLYSGGKMQISAIGNIMEIVADLIKFNGNIDFQDATLSNVKTSSDGSHNHGIPDDAIIATYNADGSFKEFVGFSQSGVHQHTLVTFHPPTP